MTSTLYLGGIFVTVLLALAGYEGLLKQIVPSNRIFRKQPWWLKARLFKLRFAQSVCVHYTRHARFSSFGVESQGCSNSGSFLFRHGSNKHYTVTLLVAFWNHRLSANTAPHKVNISVWAQVLLGSQQIVFNSICHACFLHRREHSISNGFDRRNSITHG